LAHVFRVYKQTTLKTDARWDISEQRFMKKSILIFTFLYSCTTLLAISSNNDCFWYFSSINGMLDEKGEIVKSTLSVSEPTSPANAYEIKFDYDSDYPNATFPITVYLNEIGDTEIIKTNKIGTIINLKASYDEYSDEIDLYIKNGSTLYLITVSENGEIRLFSKNSSSTEFQSIRYFRPNNDVMKQLYNIRFGVLRDKLRKINWRKSEK
jgi:hypothetical protein